MEGSQPWSCCCLQLSKAFDCNAHLYTRAQIHTHTCSHGKCVCVCKCLFTITVKLLSKEYPGVTEVEHNADRMVSSHEEMDEVETRFKLTQNVEFYSIFSFLSFSNLIKIF